MRTSLRYLMILSAFCPMVLLWSVGMARADEPAPTPAVVIVVLAATPTPTPIPLPAPSVPPIPTATPRPELPDYAYPAEDARCLSRGIWSVCPRNPTRLTKRAFCELAQNRVDDDSGDFEDSIRWVLLQGNECFLAMTLMPIDLTRITRLPTISWRMA